MKETTRTVSSIIAVASLLVFTINVSSSGLSPNWREEMQTGYTLIDVILVQNFTSTPDNITVTPSARAGIQYTTEGLVANFSVANHAVSIENTSLHSKSYKVNVTVEPALTTLPLILIRWGNTSGTGYINLYMYFYEYKIQLTWYDGLHGGTPQKTEFLRYDVNATQTFSLAGYITLNGLAVQWINGYRYEYQAVMKWTGLQYHRITLQSGTIWTNASRLIKLHELALSTNSTVAITDKLHGTLTPWGYDANFAFQFHADASRPETLQLYYDLCVEYGIRGNLDVWVENSSTKYALRDPAYLTKIIALEGLGNHIGVHTFSHDLSTNRTESLILAQEFVELLGHTPESWSDHGSMNTNINIEGDNPSSEYYMGDYIRSIIGSAWGVDAAAPYLPQSINSDYSGVYYADPEHPNLDMFREARQALVNDVYGFSESILGNTTIQPIVTEREVRAYHDYIRYWIVVHDNDTITDYTFWFAEDGTVHSLTVGDLDQKNYYQDHNRYSFSVRPKILVLLDGLANYSIWYSPINDIVTRSKLIQNVTVDDQTDTVVITNNALSSVEGFTLWTRTEPDYALYDSVTNSFYYSRFNNYSYSFVVATIPGNDVLVLTKVAEPTHVTITGVRTQSWSVDDVIQFVALQSGSVSMSYDKAMQRVSDLTTGEDVTWFTDNGMLNIIVLNGHVYEILGYSQTITTFINITFLFLYLGVTVGIAVTTTAPLKQDKNRTPQKMTKIFIQMVVFIIIALIIINMAQNIFTSG